MADIKRTMRDTEQDAKEAWRGIDGESPSDKVANARDRAENALKHAGDKLHEKTDEVGRDMAYEQGRVDEASQKR